MSEEKLRDKVEITSEKLISAPVSLDAGARFVGPFELDSVAAKLAGFPCTDVTDFAMVVVVPALPGNGIGDRLAKFVRGRRGQCIEHRKAAGATGTASIRHYGVVN